MARSDYLFTEADWHSIQERQQRAMFARIDEIDGDRLLNTSVEDLATYFEAQYRIEVPTLQDGAAAADQKEVEIDVSRDPHRYISNRNRPFYVRGTQVELTVPFMGEAEVFKIRPTKYTLNPPRAEVRGGEIVVIIRGTNLDAQSVRQELDQTLNDIRQYLAWLRSNTDEMNRQLRALATERIQHRREKLLGDRNLVSALGFPLRQRAGATHTFVAPEVRRRITPTMPAPSTKAFKPEPTLSEADYSHILSVITNMAMVMERSPSAFASMDEEALRTHFLVQLNGHYEGQATGETFNYEGKTDILIRRDGRNLFIAECKYWGGPKTLTGAIDQILSYASWRDTKVAIIVFNRNKGFTEVLKSIGQTVIAHPNYKREVRRLSESSVRYLFAHRDDANRELILTTLAFEVPQAQR